MPQLTEEEIKKAVDATFQKYDVDKNGILEKTEVLPMLQDAVRFLGKSYKVDEFDVQEFIKMADANKNRKLEKKEIYTIFKKVVKPIWSFNYSS